MTLAITPLGDCLGAEATGVDLRDPTPEDVTALAAALDDHVVLCVRGQRFTPLELLAAARRFGPGGARLAQRTPGRARRGRLLLRPVAR